MCKTYALKRPVIPAQAGIRKISIKIVRPYWTAVFRPCDSCSLKRRLCPVLHQKAVGSSDGSGVVQGVVFLYAVHRRAQHGG